MCVYYFDVYLDWKKKLLKNLHGNFFNRNFAL
jgi:hypothetical protein